MNIKCIFPVFAFFIAIISACSSEEPKQEPKPVVKKIMQPFRFHKAVEVRPGLTLDIVSWGRGSNSVGGYLVLRSDSTKMDYRSVSGELDGKIVDAWDMDLDSDGNPELYIQAKGEGKGSYLNMYIYEYSEGGSNQKLKFPELNSSLNEGYRGLDSVYVKDGKLMREFPVFDSNDSSSHKTGQSRKIEYSLRNNNFQYKELKEEDIKKK